MTATPGPKHGSPDLSRTFVILPAYNEAPRIRSVVEGVLGIGARVIVVDDGSSDGTGSRLDGLPVTVLRHAFNLGQGAALQTGIEAALDRGARFVVTFDSDGQHEESDIPRLIEALGQDDLDVVLGSRFLGKAPGMWLGRRVLLKLAVLFTRFTSGLKLTDTHNGLRAFKASAAARIKLTQNRMAHASEILSLIKMARLRCKEIPTTVRYRKGRKGQSGLGSIDILYDLFLKRITG